MLTIPENIKELYKADNTTTETHKYFRLKFYEESEDTLYPYETLFPDEGLFPAEHSTPWLVIENDKIVSESLTITESLSTAEDIVFGSCESSKCEITVADINEDLTNREFVLTVEIGGYEMMLGMYTVQSFVRQSDRRKRKITAYDRMNRFNVDVADWYNNLPFPTTLKTFRDSLCDYIGVPQNPQTLIFDTLQITKTIEPEEISGADVLSAICEINGCFGHVDNTGNLKYIYLQQTGLYPSESLYPEETLYPSEYGGDGQPMEYIPVYKHPIQYEDYLVEGIDGVNIRQEEGDVGASAGEGSNPYVIEGNFLVYGKSAADLLNIAQSLLPYIYGRTYRPATIDCNCRPWVEVGDAVIAPTKDDVVETFVMNRTITGCQNMRDKYEATGNPIREEQFTINKQIIQLEGKTTIIEKDVEGVKVTVSDLKEYTEAQFEITSNRITAEVTAREEGDAELSGRITVEANRITAEVTRAQEAEAALDIRADSIELSVSQKVSTGEVTQHLNSELTITGNSINLTTGHFTIDADNLTVDAQGNATFSGNITGATGIFTGGVHSNDVIITGGHIDIDTVDTETSIIHLQYQNNYAEMASGYVQVGDGSTASMMLPDYIFTDTLEGDRVYATDYMQCNGDMRIMGNLDVSGVKNRSVKTQSYGDVLQYCYEMAMPMFGDIGSDVVGEDGTCQVALDDVFLETVATGMEYFIFLQKESNENLWVQEKGNGYFIVSGTPGTHFMWEVKFHQKDYETTRLEKQSVYQMPNRYKNASEYYLQRKNVTKEVQNENNNV